MVKLVFVHGVATRASAETTLAETNRNKLFKAALTGEATDIWSPHWGDLVPSLLFEGASFAKNEVRTLSLTGGMAPAATTNGNETLAAIAGQDPLTAVDLLFAEEIRIKEEAGQALTDPEVREFAAVASLLAEPDDALEPFAQKLAASADDQAFALEVARVANGPASLSIGSALRNAADSLSGRIRNLVSRGLNDEIVARFNPAVAMFLGDIFVYLNRGEIRTSIRKCVVDALQAAHSAKASHEPLIVVGHSLGGVILLDLLTNGAEELPADFRIDGLVTVGSQPGLFRELSVIGQPFTAGKSHPPLANVGYWINAFDPIDVFGFRASPMFEQAEDYSFKSLTGLFSAHTTYFQRPQFYGRLRRRLVAAGVLS